MGRQFAEFCERLAWAHVQRKGILTKNDLKWRLKFARKVCCKLPANFWEEGVGFYLEGGSCTHKMNPFDQARDSRGYGLEKPWTRIWFRFHWKGKSRRHRRDWIVKQRLCQDALDHQKTRENFAVFSTRVKTTLETIPIDVVDQTILSMGKRINEIIKRKGQRIKY